MLKTEPQSDLALSDPSQDAKANLLTAAPWLTEYGFLFVDCLVHSGVQRVEDISSLPMERLLQVPEANQQMLWSLSAAKVRISDSLSSTPDSCKAALLEAIPWLGNYSTRLLNCLARAGAKTVQEVLSISPEEFALVKGVGATTINDLRLLQQRVARVDSASIIGSRTAPAARDEAIHSLTAEVPSPAATVPAVAKSVDVRSVLPELSGFSTRFITTLLVRAKLVTVGKILETSPRDFARKPWVGRNQAEEFRVLQEELRAWLAQVADGATPEVVKADQLPSSPPEPHCEVPSAPEPDSLQEIVEEVLAALPLAYSEVWQLRREQGLMKSEVARRLGMPQMQVSRLESKVRAKLAQHLIPVYAAVEASVAAYLGCCRLSALPAEVQQRMGWREAPSPEETRQLLSDVMRVDDDSRLQFGGPNGGGADLVHHRDVCHKLWRATTKQAEQLHAGIDRRQNLLDFCHRLNAALSVNLACDSKRNLSQVPCCGAKDGQVRLPTEYVAALLSLMEPCPLEGQDILGTAWAALRRGRSRQVVIRAALEILGKPGHYSEIARFVREHSETQRAVTAAMVHHCLMGDPECVMTGAPGTYGLKSWGVERRQTVADRLEQLLRERGAPLPMREVCTILGREGIKETNIQACLHQQRFVRTESRSIGLSEWGLGAPTGDASGEHDYVWLVGERLQVNLKRKAALVGSGLRTDRFQRLVRFAGTEGELTGDWREDAEGNLMLDRRRYASDNSWTASSHSSLERALFRIARAKGLISQAGARSPSASASSGTPAEKSGLEAGGNSYETREYVAGLAFVTDEDDAIRLG
jgi:RNA polymerase sigma factor (sigma-70 family)